MSDKESRVEHRGFCNTIELREEGEDKLSILSGIASPFGKESEDMGFKEVVKRGAFKNALLRDDTVALFNHRADYVLGRVSNGKLRLREGTQGLKAEIDAPQSGFLKDMVVDKVADGSIRGMSIGFIVAEGGDEITKRKDGSILRTIHEVEELIDVSVVTFPAYRDTKVAVRSIDAWLKQTSESNDTEEDADKEDPKITPDAHSKIRERELNLKKNRMEI